MLLYIMLVHWLGDFIFQSREMADNKGKSLKWLFMHGFIYTMVLYIGICVITFANPINIIDIALFSIFVGSLHIVIDGITGRVTHYFWDKGKVNHFFSTIGFDQWLHFATIYLALSILK